MTCVPRKCHCYRADVVRLLQVLQSAAPITVLRLFLTARRGGSVNSVVQYGWSLEEAFSGFLLLLHSSVSVQSSERHTLHTKVGLFDQLNSSHFCASLVSQISQYIIFVVIFTNPDAHQLSPSGIHNILSGKARVSILELTLMKLVDLSLPCLNSRRKHFGIALARCRRHLRAESIKP